MINITTSIEGNLIGILKCDGTTITSISTSAALASAIRDKIGTGSLIFGTLPTFTTGITISGTTGTAINISKSANTAGTIKAHCHQMAAVTDDSPNQYANEFKGEFLATSGTMDGISSHYQMAASGTGVMRSIIGVSYLNAGVTLSGTSPTASWISGGLFSTSLAATSVLNGTAVVAYGLYSEVTGASGSILTSCAHTAGAAIYSKLLVKPTSGECSILHFR